MAAQITSNHEDHKEPFDVGVHHTPTHEVVKTRMQTILAFMNGLYSRPHHLARPRIAAVERAEAVEFVL